jgi:phosphoglycolate phosphatase-like HAD superfamily hydrolase
MELNERPLLLLDGDNTLWKWMEYAVPAYEAMCAVIAQMAGKTKIETAAAMKRVYSRKRTIENVLLIQGLKEDGFFNGVRNFDENEAIRIAMRTFSRVRSQHLQLYPGVKEVMETAHKKGWRQIMLTDAPGHQARRRLERTGVDHLVECIFAMPTGSDLPPSKARYRGLRESPIPVFEVEHEKPYTDLEGILKMTRDQIRALVYMWGDNDKKDMELARRWGMRGLFAVYGGSDPDLSARLQPFAPESVLRRNSSLLEAESRSSHGLITPIHHPFEVLSVL